MPPIAARQALATLVRGQLPHGICRGQGALSHLHPAFGFVAAFAEAATIGGLADWYAVVALFRRPLGLPIPHTAIIQSNQQRIADRLGEFIEVHFLEAAPVEAKLRQIDFASFVADWLGDRKRSADLARFVLRLLPEAMSATETSGLRPSWSAASHPAAMIICAAGGRHVAPFVQKVGIRAADDIFRVHNPDRVGPWRWSAKNCDEPHLETLSRRYIQGKIVASATTFFEEVADPQHPLRGEFDRMVRRSSTGWQRRHADRIDGLSATAGAAELGASRKIWSNARVLRAQRVARRRCAAISGKDVRRGGDALAGDAELRGEINQGLVAVLTSFIADQKSGVSTFISDQVKSWDMAQLISLIEINIGKDLQYIRFNGSLIGGLAGLGLYSIEFLLRWL